MIALQVAFANERDDVFKTIVVENKAVEDGSGQQDAL
jgi:hypothetical protein